MRILGAIFLVIIGLWEPSYAVQGFGEYQQFEFAPMRQQTFPIPITLEQKSTVTIEIFGPDRHLVRTLTEAQAFAVGSHTVVWDGKDDSDIIVPDEIYVPVLKIQPETGTEIVIDPHTSGGEELDGLGVKVTADRDVSYSLPVSARVLIRVGLKAGPMLRSLAVWQPRGPGKNIQRWDGRDSNDLQDLRSHERLSILVRAFKLQDHAIITTGNGALTYRDYSQQKGWQQSVLNSQNRVLMRNNQRIAREYYWSQSEYADPEISLNLIAEEQDAATNLPVVQSGQRTPIKVDIVKRDRWLMNEEQYEVAFFLDGKFIAEEEQGYVPITWNWRPANLAAGEHMLTVNISGFSGKIGVASVLFVTPK